MSDSESGFFFMCNRIKLAKDISLQLFCTAAGDFLGSNYWILNIELLYYYRVRPPSFDIVHHKLSCSNISRTVWPRITTFYMDIHTDLLYSNNRYDVTNFFMSEVITKMPPPMASVGISREQFKGSQNFTHLSETVGLTNLPDMKSLAAFLVGCKMQLNNARKCIEQVRPANESNN